MTTKDPISVDGMPNDGVGHDLVTAKTLAKFQEASEQLSRFRTPLLVHVGRPQEKLYIAAFDGTGNDRFKSPVHATHVAKISHGQRAYVYPCPARLCWQASSSPAYKDSYGFLEA